MLIVVAVVVVVMIFVVVVAVAIVAFVAAKWQTIEDRWPPAGRCGGGVGEGEVSGGEVRLLPKSRPPPLPRRVKTPSQPAPATSQPKLRTNDEHFYLT